MKTFLKEKSGFTLVELLVVIAIIGLLTSIALYSVNTARMKARDAKRMADLKQVQKALELYYDKHNAYPAIGSAWQCSCSDGGCASKWYTALKPLVDEGFLSELPSDPINNVNGSTYFCYEYTPSTFTSNWFCNGIRRTDYSYALLFSAENSSFDLPKVTGTVNYDYCISGPLK